MAGHKPTELDSAQDADQRFELFLERAAPILAIERGLNAKSRVKLAVLASALGLPEDQLNDAISALQSTPKEVETSDNPQFIAFCRFLNARLKKIPRGILTADTESRAVLIAQKNYKLSEEHAREAIRKVAAARNIRRISLSAAKRYIAELVDQLVGDSAWIDDASKAKLRSAGKEWGLKEKDVDALIRLATDANHRRERKDRWVVVTALSLGTAIALALGAFLFSVMLPGESQQTVTPAETENNHPDNLPDHGIKTSVPVRKIKIPLWWDEDLSIALNQGRVLIADLNEIYPAMASSEAKQRASAYVQIVELCEQDNIEADRLPLIRNIIASCYVLEDDDDSSTSLRDALLVRVQAETGKLPDKKNVYRNAFWAIDVCLAALRHEMISQQRADLLLLAMGQALGTAIDKHIVGSDLDRHCFEALTRSLYQQLRLGVSKQPQLARQLQGKLLRYAELSITSKELEQLNTDFLVAALSSSSDGWQEYIEFIKDAVFSSNPINTIKAINLFEQVDNAEFRDEIGEYLRLRTELPSQTGSVAEIAAAFREKLGIKPSRAAKTARDRWQMIQNKAQQLQKEIDPATKNYELLLQQSVDFAHLATLALAVAQQEPGFALFDQLLDQGPTSLSEKEDEENKLNSALGRSTRPVATPPPTRIQREKFKRYINSLRNYQKTLIAERMTSLRGLMELTERIKEIEPHQGTVIATYLLAPKATAEQARLLEPAQKVALWKYVRLSLADQLIDSKLPKEQLSQLLSAALQREIKIDDAADRLSVSRHLKRDVLLDLEPTAAKLKTTGSGRSFERAADALLELYRSRGSALGVSPAAYRSTNSPAQMLELLINSAAGLMSGSALPAEGKQLLSDLPHELAVIEYLGNNDLKRTVMLQRLWLRLLAINVAQKQSKQASQVTTLLDKLQRRDAEGENLLHQLSSGEQTTLALWMLLSP